MTDFRSMPVDKQILNIASELSRAKKWLGEKNEELFKASLERAFDLVDASVAAAHQNAMHSLSRELLRMREFLGEFYSGADTDTETFLLSTKNLLDLTSDTHELHLEL